MDMQKIELLASAEATHIMNEFKSLSCEYYDITYDKRGKLSGDFSAQFAHKGIYGFRVEKADKCAVAYIGKDETGNRLRQHILSQNKDGSPLAETTRTK